MNSVTNLESAGVDTRATTAFHSVLRPAEPFLCLELSALLSFELKALDSLPVDIILTLLGSNLF